MKNDAEGLERFAHTIHLCEAIEVAQESYCSKSRLFEPQTMSMEQIERGYEQNEAYRWLKRHGGSDGMYEAQTVLNVQDEKVSLVIQRIKAEYRVRAEQDEAMEVPNETQIEEPGWTETWLCEGTEA